MFQDFSALQWNVEKDKSDNVLLNLQSLDCRPYTRYEEDYSDVYETTFYIPYTFMSYVLQDNDYLITPDGGLSLRGEFQRSGRNADCKENYNVFYVGDFANGVFLRYVNQGAFDYGHRGLYDYPTSAYIMLDRRNNNANTGYTRINGTASYTINSVIQDVKNVMKKSKKVNEKTILKILQSYQR